VLANPQTPLAEVLTLLDALVRGRTALEAIHGDDQFGRTVFGSDWRPSILFREEVARLRFLQRHSVSGHVRWTPCYASDRRAGVQTHPI